MIFRSAPVAALVAAAVSGSAFAQPIVPVSQVRLISGDGTITDPSGPIPFGPHLFEAPEGNFGSWAADLIAPGQMSFNASQEGGLIAEDRIQLTRFSMSMGAGGGPGTSGACQMRNEFTYTFTVAEGTTYTFSCNIGCAGPGTPPGTSSAWDVTAFLAQGAADIFRLQTSFDNNFNISIGDLTGTLNAGTYTLSVVGTGAVEYDGGSNGNGTGGGAGGVEPAMTFVAVAPTTPACPADLGMSGGLPGQDGTLNNNDFIAFITYFFAQDARADLGVAAGLPGSDGQWNNNDFIAFITLFFAGC